MTFRPIGPVGFVRVGRDAHPGLPDNRTTYLQALFESTLTFSLIDGSPFSLDSVDLAEYSTVVSNAARVHFIGYRFDGSVVTTDFITDGIIDGTGPLADFQTFKFDDRFTGLTRVEIPTFGWSLDNLMVSVPEPSTWGLLLVGGLCLGALKFRQRGGRRPRRAGGVRSIAR